MTTLGIYTRYSERGASSRLRCYRYAPLLRAHGFDVTVHPLMGDDTLAALYAGRSRRGKLARDLAKRLFTFPSAERNLWIEYELFPGVPFAAEKCLIGSSRYVLSFDDAVYLNYREHPLLRRKFQRLAAGAAGIMAANDLLLEYFTRFNSNTVKIPTAVDTDALRPGTEKFPRFTVVWIGTPVTFRRHLAPAAPMLGALAEELDFDLAVVGGGTAAAELLPRARCFPWSEELECDLLPRCHAGIMPLPANDGFAAGKSAYKLLQYMAAGLPSVASPVGENRVVIRPGGTGFFASSPEEWRRALRQLVTDRERCAAMAAAARAAAEKDYSVRRYAPVIADFFKKTFSDA